MLSFNTKINLNYINFNTFIKNNFNKSKWAKLFTPKDDSSILNRSLDGITGKTQRQSAIILSRLFNSRRKIMWDSGALTLKPLIKTMSPDIDVTDTTSNFRKNLRKTLIKMKKHTPFIKSIKCFWKPMKSATKYTQQQNKEYNLKLVILDWVLNSEVKIPELQYLKDMVDEGCDTTLAETIFLLDFVLGYPSRRSLKHKLPFYSVKDKTLNKKILSIWDKVDVKKIYKLFNDNKFTNKILFKGRDYMKSPYNKYRIKYFNDDLKKENGRTTELITLIEEGRCVFFNKIQDIGNENTSEFSTEIDSKFPPIDISKLTNKNNKRFTLNSLIKQSDTALKRITQSTFIKSQLSLRKLKYHNPTSYLRISLDSRNLEKFQNKLIDLCYELKNETGRKFSKLYDKLVSQDESWNFINNCKNFITSVVCYKELSESKKEATRKNRATLRPKKYGEISKTFNRVSKELISHYGPFARLSRGVIMRYHLMLDAISKLITVRNWNERDAINYCRGRFLSRVFSTLDETTNI